MKHKTLIIFTLFLIIIFLAFTNKSTEIVTAFKIYGDSEPSHVYALKLPEVIDFCGESVPLDTPDIIERLDKELLVNTYWQSNMMLLLKRTNKWFPMIEAILKEEGVPEDFKYLPVIESGLDERYHVEKSTRVACKYLLKAKERFGSWTLAAASYNRGMYGIDKLLNKQKVDNYYDLLLNTETKRYVFRILAVKEILSRPDHYGFVFEERDLYKPIPVRKIGLDVPIANIADFAKDQGVNYKILKNHNPWLIQNHLNNNSRKYYEILVPKLDN